MKRWPQALLTACITAAVIVTGTILTRPAGGAIDLAGPVDPHPLAAAPAELRPKTPMTVFVPIVPCRTIDTRPGQIAAGSTRDFVIRGGTGFVAQGGKPGGCGVPVTATGVAVSVSSVKIGGTGYFRIWPYGLADPGATIAHYEAGPITTTGGTLTLAAAGSAYDVTAMAFDAPANLVVDITRYYDTQIQATVLGDATIYEGTGHVIAATRTSTGVYELLVGRNISACTAVASAIYSGGDPFYGTAIQYGTNQVLVRTWKLVAGRESLSDANFQITVTC